MLMPIPPRLPPAARQDAVCCGSRLVVSFQKLKPGVLQHPRKKRPVKNGFFWKYSQGKSLFPLFLAPDLREGRSRTSDRKCKAMQRAGSKIDFSNELAPRGLNFFQYKFHFYGCLGRLWAWQLGYTGLRKQEISVPLVRT